MGREGSVACQLQACNVIHILGGFVALALAGTQFSHLKIENYQQIDFRALNWIHVLTGGVGIYMVRKNYGSIGAKVLYMTTVIVGLFTAGFYGATLAPVVERYKDMVKTDGSQMVLDYHRGRIAVCSIMIAISFIQAGVGLIANNFLNELASDGRSERIYRPGMRGKLGFVGGMKIFFGLLTLGLGAGMEVQYKLTDINAVYIKIGWQMLAGAFIAASGFQDVIALYASRHNLLNLKVAVVLSIVASVLSLKTVDVMMSTFFLHDVIAYTKIKSATLSSSRISSSYFTTEDPDSLRV